MTWVRATSPSINTNAPTIVTRKKAANIYMPVNRKNANMPRIIKSANCHSNVNYLFRGFIYILTFSMTRSLFKGGFLKSLKKL